MGWRLGAPMERDRTEWALVGLLTLGSAVKVMLVVWMIAGL